MHITINDSPLELTEDVSLFDVLTRLNHPVQGVAVAVNHTIVPKTMPDASVTSRRQRADLSGYCRRITMLTIAETTFTSRLFVGTGKFASANLMTTAIEASGSQLATMAMKRVSLGQQADDLVSPLSQLGIRLLPNTSGAKNAEEAVFAARLAKEALGTRWLKLEIHPDTRYLLPDPVETLKAAEQLVKEGFVVLPYCGADPVLCKRLEEVGCAAVMPLGAPIGSNMGLQTQAFLRIIIEQSMVPVIVDAGIGAPSHAAQAMEMGADAVLVNTAIAVARDPIGMANAFRLAVESGRQAYRCGLGTVRQDATAEASSPLTAFLHTESPIAVREVQ